MAGFFGFTKDEVRTLAGVVALVLLSLFDFRGEQFEVDTPYVGIPGHWVVWTVLTHAYAIEHLL